MSDANIHNANRSDGDSKRGLDSMDARGCVIKTRHGMLDARQRTVLMGVINVTPDSFYDGGKRLDPDRAVADGMSMVEAGADILDIGGESTRPGAGVVSTEEELQRVLPVIQRLRRHVNVPISIDTYKAQVARAALIEGADIVNDISALRFDPQMALLVAVEKVPVVLMHMQGTPQTMQAEPRYKDVLQEVHDFLTAQVRFAIKAGVDRENIIIDPGIGFGKTLEVEADERLEGSLAAAIAAVFGGAHIIRAHDVKETRKAIRVADAIRFGVPEAER